MWLCAERHSENRQLFISQFANRRGHSSVLLPSRGRKGGECIKFPEKMSCGDVRFNVIRVTRGWTGVKFPEKSVKYHSNGSIQYYL